MADNSNQVPTSPNQRRWWEGYLVRYLVGSLVGAICLTVLAAEIFYLKPHSIQTYQSILSNYLLNEKNGTTVSIGLLVLGCLYCYLAPAQPKRHLRDAP